MKSIPVIATARSRLQADVMLIRLRRADVPIQAISAIFPRSHFPNSVACWLRPGQLAPVSFGQEELLAAGPLRRWLRSPCRRAFDPDRLFRRAGFDGSTSQRLQEALGQGDILIGVHAASEAQVAVAWHIFRHAESECIALPAGSARRSVPAEQDALALFPSFDAAIPA